MSEKLESRCVEFEGCLRIMVIRKKSLNIFKILQILILKTKTMSELALKWGKEAKEKRLTRLDLGNCGLTELPDAGYAVA
jgi:hypothetical protein